MKHPTDRLAACLTAALPHLPKADADEARAALATYQRARTILLNHLPNMHKLVASVPLLKSTLSAARAAFYKGN